MARARVCVCVFTHACESQIQEVDQGGGKRKGAMASYLEPWCVNSAESASEIA